MKFWKENRLDKEYTLTIDEIKAKYKEYLEQKEVYWIEYYAEKTVPFFISDKEGLNSVTEIENYIILQEYLKEIRRQIIRFYKGSIL